MMSEGVERMAVKSVVLKLEVVGKMGKFHGKGSVRGVGGFIHAGYWPSTPRGGPSQGLPERFGIEAGKEKCFLGMASRGRQRPPSRI